METKTRILKLIYEKKGVSATDLAKKLKTSLPNIMQHLKDLKKEYPLVSMRVAPTGRGKPKLMYYFKHSFRGFGRIKISGVSKNHGVIEKVFDVDNYLNLHLNILQIPQKELRYYIEKFYWNIEKYIPKIDVIAIFGSSAKGTAREDSDIDCLIITGYQKELEDKIGSLIIKKVGKNPKIFLSQFFSKKEFYTNLKKGSKFSKEILKNSIIIYDKDSFLRRLKNEFRE